jgi:glutamine synthetase
MDRAEVKRLIDDGKIEYVKIGTPDVEGVYRGKRVTADYFLQALNGGFPQCDVIFGWDIAENVLPNLKVSNWEHGFADIILQPDLSTFKLVPWEDRVASCICDAWTEQGEPVSVSPRYVLSQVVERARALGYEPMAASELEFRFFRETMNTLREKDFGPQLAPLNPGMNCYAISQASADDHLLRRIATSMRGHGIEIEGYNREHGPGMYEMNLHYTSAVTAADNTLLFKTGVKEICHQEDLTACFMAKWSDQEDGSSGHSHLSLWDRKLERNLFWQENDEEHMSETMNYFLAGVLDKLPELMGFYAPVINSYKRYVEGTWAPLNTTWGLENRTCAVRIITNGKKAMRIENRVPGADANFYLVFAAMLASGLYGIEHKLKLPARLEGNAYDPAAVAQAVASGQIKFLAHNLAAATDLLEQSQFAREYLGEEFIEHFVATRRWEIKEHEKAVTNWERRRYLELI